MKVRAGTIQAKVLSYLQTGHSLDNMKATALFGSIRLSGAILGLREKAHCIKTETFKGPEGNTMSFYRYMGELTVGSKVTVNHCVHGTVTDVASYRGEVQVKLRSGFLYWYSVADVELLNA